MHASKHMRGAKREVERVRERARTLGELGEKCGSK